MSTLDSLTLSVDRSFETSSTSVNGVVVSSKTVTRFTLLLERDTRLKVVFKPEGLVEKVVKLSRKELQTGDAAFDAAISISTDTPGETTRWLGDENTRLLIQALVRGGPVEIDGTSVKAGVEEGFEGTGRVLVGIELDLVDAEGGKDTSGDQETCAVDGSIVGEANRDPIVGKLVCIGSSNDKVTLDAGTDDLTDDVRVCDANDETVLWCVVLVLVLDDQTFAGIVVGLALTTTTVLNLEAFEVGLVLDGLDKRLCKVDVRTKVLR
jgi:hypothetical protein